MALARLNEDISHRLPHDALADDLSAILPPERLVRDPLRTLAYGTDASFYRLIPKIVAIVDSEAEVEGLLRLTRKYGTPLTFRAAGTSLSGQAVSDSVLAVLGSGWGDVEIAPDGQTIRLQPGVIGSDANRHLARFGRKIGPDPASINACKIGGIAANNASGMCCGTAQNSYHTLAGLRVMLADGTVLDTLDPASRADFARSHVELLDGLAALAARVRQDDALAARIRRKFAIKNTTGYSLNALVDFTDPFEILQHLMIGSEGTLGFIAEVTYRTVVEHAHKASALMLFPNIVEACRAVILMKPTPVSAVELMDRAALRSVEDKPGLPDFIRGLPDGATALLVETRGEDPQTLQQNIAAITGALDGIETLRAIAFTAIASEYERFWNIRKGLLPSVGAMRPTGTTVIIEDVAFPIEKLAAATADLTVLLDEYGYREAILFGHALEGNLHFVFTQDFGDAKEVDRYRRFMDAVCSMVVDRYDGSLKAEHGTGRNMAPFVELEWGAQAYQLMREIKALFDPDGLLNPGVLLNDDPHIHLKNLKPLPAADAAVDQCMECGFCERMCPSQGLTLTPRQRIVGWREISRLQESGAAAERAALVGLYDYQGLETCAACGLCATACPVSINTGLLTKTLRGQGQGTAARRVAGWLADHYGTTLAVSRQGLRLTDLAARAFGQERMEKLAGSARRLSGDRLPAWTPAMPSAASFDPTSPAQASSTLEGNGSAERELPAVVYLPSCASRTMGPARGDPDQQALPEKTAALLRKAGFRVIYPSGLADLCCGQPFDSKGLSEVADRKAKEVERALIEASGNGALPIVSDTSPCSFRLKEKLPEHLRPLDIVEFIHDRMMERLVFRRQQQPVALHLTCSGRKMGLEGKLRVIGEACAEIAVIPDSIGCCGWAGDKGFTTPELNAHALRTLASALPEGCTAGYSHSRTCEIGLSMHAGVPYQSIVYLVDACTTKFGAER
ncbi:MAG: FAD-binding oxidoreductase [Rhodospirillales bacterium]|nr:FAD-binding oxidoreductase [Rhodospirillales bacterium]